MPQSKPRKYFGRVMWADGIYSQLFRQTSATDKMCRSAIIFLSARSFFFEVSLRKPAPLAQLDRASDYESEGREFESLRARHSFVFRDQIWPTFCQTPL